MWLGSRARRNGTPSCQKGEAVLYLPSLPAAQKRNVDEEIQKTFTQKLHQCVGSIKPMDPKRTSMLPQSINMNRDFDIN